MVRKVADSIWNVGVDDHDVDLFEGQYRVPNGMCYNSYVILDESVAVMDTVDRRQASEWLANLREVLNGREPDYLVIDHMEPDHSGSAAEFLKAYPEATVVGNARTFQLLDQFFPSLAGGRRMVVGDGQSLSLGGHELQFLFAPMVHWPEVMMSYEKVGKTLFSADAFGKFGASDAREDWDCEARRYYIGIVGKFGAQVQGVLKKAAELPIETICPLHGPVLTENLGKYLNLYDVWSSYRPEAPGVCLCYTSVYGHTREAVEELANLLRGQGEENVVCHDLCRCDMAEALADAFRFDRLVLATTTYNGDIFPPMKTFLNSLTAHNFQNRTVALVENGSWGPTAARGMAAALQNARGIRMAENQVTIRSALNQESRAKLAALAKELAGLR